MCIYDGVLLDTRPVAGGVLSRSMLTRLGLRGLKCIFCWLYSSIRETTVTSGRL